MRWLLPSVIALVACSPAPRVLTSGAPASVNADFAPRIDSMETWRALAASPEREMVAHTEVVKVILDLEDHDRVYFLQSRRWEIHYFFARHFLATPLHPIEDHEAFNLREYRNADRRFVLGTLAHYRDGDTWTYELVAGDTLDVARTVHAFEVVRSLFFLRDRLRYRPVPALHEAAIDAFRAAGVPVVTTQQVFGALTYQPINPGVAYGYLRFFHGVPDAAHVRRTDIVVLDNVPLDIPVCAGVITAEFQTPLSHVAILAANRGTPDMALRNAMASAPLRALEGRLVQLHVTPQEWTIAPARQSDAEHAWEHARPPTGFSAQLSLEDVGLPDVATLRSHDVQTVGAKAAQLGELARIGPPVIVPRGFALPFRAYQQHLVQSGLDRELTQMLDDARFQREPTVREARLAQFRSRLEQAPVDPTLLAALRVRIASLLPPGRVRLRSSTNAEDLPGFNGAGLYRSVVIPAHFTDAQLSDGLRSVWSSVWNTQGYEERAYFRIDAHRVAMAVLVQESIDDDVVNGVAITANPFNAGRPALFINAQVAGGEGGAVTSARGDEVPEQWMYYTYAGEREFERLSRSSRTHGAPVLTDDEVVRLAESLRAVHRHFLGDGTGGGLAYDIEFILAGPSRRIVLVQARPFTVHYDEGRGYAEDPDGL